MSNDFDFFKKEHIELNQSLSFVNRNVKDYEAEIKEVINGTYIKPISTGIKELDKHFRYFLGMLLLISGYPQCFDGEQLVHTEKGVRRIKDISTSDKVLSFNHEKKETEYKKVQALIKNKPVKRMIEIKMKDGTSIRVTEDHEFFNGYSYLKIGDILLTCCHDKRVETNS